MEILNITEDNPSTVNIPKLSTTRLELKNNYFVATDGNKFNYYTIKVVDKGEGSLLMSFEKSPPVLLEGLAIVDRKIYKVSVDDLMRRVIRKTKVTSLEAINGTNSNTGSTTNTLGESGTDSAVRTIVVGGGGSTTVSDLGQSNSESEIGLEEHEAANKSWEDQVGALLSALHKEEGGIEEFEISETP